MDLKAARVSIPMSVLNEVAPKTLAAELGVPSDRIHEVRSRLRREGRLAPSRRQVDGVLSTAGRRRGSSRSLARSSPEPVRVSAIRALEDLDRQSGRQVGPPDPMSDDEVFERLARVLEFAGREIPTRAMHAVEARGVAWNDATL